MRNILISLIALIATVSGQDFPTCNPNTVTWHPHPLTCEQYIICFHGNIIERSCAPGLHFSSENLHCTFPELANCDDGSNPCPRVDDQQNPAFVPNPNDCGSYYVCFNGDLIQRSCAENLWWDVNDEWCTYVNGVTCDPRTPNNPNPPTEQPVEVTSPPTTEPPTTTPPTTTTPDPNTMDCPLTPGTTFHPHSLDCEKYFICIDGIAFLRTCESGLIFDIVNRHCDEPQVALCISGN